MVEFKNLTKVKTTDNGILLKNEAGVEAWFPKSQITSQSKNEDDSFDIECEDFLADNFKVALVEGVKILSKNDKNTAVRVIQEWNDKTISTWIPMYVISNIDEEAGVLTMKIDMAEEKGLEYTVT